MLCFSYFSMWTRYVPIEIKLLKSLQQEISTHTESICLSLCFVNAHYYTISQELIMNPNKTNNVFLFHQSTFIYVCTFATLVSSQCCQTLPNSICVVTFISAKHKLRLYLMDLSPYNMLLMLLIHLSILLTVTAQRKLN